MALIPLRCSDINRRDYQAILKSVIAQRGDAVQIIPGTVMYVECVAEARLIYNLRLQNEKLKNQFNPTTMTDFLLRWEIFLGIQSTQQQTLAERRQRILTKLQGMNRMPTYRALFDMLKSNIQDFVSVSNPTVETAINFFPGGSGGYYGNGPWFSTISELFIELYQPQGIPDQVFYSETNVLPALLDSFIPAFAEWNWFANSFTDGYGLSTISTTVGSYAVVGSGTYWNQPINVADGINVLMPGDQIEFYDDNGIWQQVTVTYISDDTHFSAESAVLGTATNKPYVMSGFYCDCDPDSFPYPPTRAKNLDVAGAFETNPHH